MSVAFFYSKDLHQYDFGEGHPFHGRRFGDFVEFLKKKLPQKEFVWIKPRPATDEELKLLHSQRYIDFVEEFYQAAYEKRPLPSFWKVYQFLSQDNLPGANPGRLNYGARLIAGAAIEAGRLVWEGKFQKAICPGGLHHAKESYGEGFCIFNDVALCAQNLKQNLGVKRILILDTDAHAGNGTAEFFYQDPEVLLIDFHQDPRTLYPGTGFAFEIGEGKGKGYTINIPLPQKAGDQCYRLVFEEIVEPVAFEFKPQIVIRNGGSDAHFEDLLTNLGLSIEGFKMIGQKVRKIAEISNQKEIDFLGSGYNQKILCLAWLALLSGLLGIDFKFKKPESPPKEKKSVIEETKKVIEEIKRNLKDYWKSLR